MLAVDLGKGVGADKKVTDPTTTFGPKDTIYASVATEGTATVTLRAEVDLWRRRHRRPRREPEHLPTGPANTEFQISKKTPWPAGKYKVEISADGVTAASKDFEIQKIGLPQPPAGNPRRRPFRKSTNLICQARYLN